MPRKGRGTNHMLLSETFFDVNSGFMKERELVAGVHISVIADVGNAGTPITLRWPSCHSHGACRIIANTGVKLNFPARPCRMSLKHILMMLPRATLLSKLVISRYMHTRLF